MISNKYIGHPSQLYGVDEYRLIGGKGDGMKLLRLRNGIGIDMTISADRCSDISELYFDGIRMNYTSPCGYVSPQYYNEGTDGFGFLNSFNCGMITTCGLQNIGVPNNNNGNFHGLHGTIGNIPASHIYYENLDDCIKVHARMNDQKIFGSKLSLNRTITVGLKENTIHLKDTISNEGSNPEAVMLLYHMNIGYPLLSETSELFINSSEVLPRDERAAENLDTWNKILKPTPNFVEQCYYHHFENEQANIKIFNPSIGKGLELTFNPEQFHHFTEWKMMGEHDYVLGLEPCTNTLEGRDAVSRKNELIYIASNETKFFEATLRLLRTE